MLKNNLPSGRSNLAEMLRGFYLENWALLLSFGLFLVVLSLLWDVLSPFVAAFVLSFLLMSPSQWLHEKTGERVSLPICSVVVLLLFVLVLSGFILLFLPVISFQIELIQTNLPKLIKGLDHSLFPWLNDVLDMRDPIDSSDIKAQGAEYVSKHRGAITEYSTTFLSLGSRSVLDFASFIVMTFLATLFILPSLDKIIQKIQQLFPPRLWEKAGPMLYDINTLLNEYVKGVAIVLVSLGAFYSIGLSLVGLETGWAIGLLAGALSTIPFLGFAVALVIGLLTATLELQGIWPVIWVFLVFMIGQVLESFVLTPLVVGDKIGLSPLAVIFALAFFGAVFGLVGVFLALPLAAIFKVAYVRAFDVYIQSDYYSRIV